MNVREYINNIQTIYFRMGKFWAWLSKDKNRKKVNNNIGELIDGQEAFDIIVTYLLGPDYYNMDTGTAKQGNPISIIDIIHNYKGFKK